MNITTSYTATSLAAIADNFEERAQNERDRATRSRTQRNAECLRASAETWEIAADFLRRTTIVSEPTAEPAEVPT